MVTLYTISVSILDTMYARAHRVPLMVVKVIHSAVAYTVSTTLTVLANQWYWVYIAGESTLYSYVVREQDTLCGDMRVLYTTQLVGIGSTAVIVLPLLTVSVVR